MCEMVDRICVAVGAPEEYRKLRLREMSKEEGIDPHFKQRLDNIDVEQKEAMQEDTSFIQEIAKGMKDG